MFVQGEGSLKMKDVTFEGNQGVNGSALAVYGNKPYESSLDKVTPVEVTATNVNYLNNVSKGKDAGAALWLYTKTHRRLLRRQQNDGIGRPSRCSVCEGCRGGLQGCAVPKQHG